MELHVGPFAYRVRMVEGVIHNSEGEACWALCDFLKQELMVSTLLGPDQRFQALMHELRHAWAYHFPTSADEEHQCDLFGNMVLQLAKDLQGLPASLPVLETLGRGAGMASAESVASAASGPSAPFMPSAPDESSNPQATLSPATAPSAPPWRLASSLDRQREFDINFTATPSAPVAAAEVPSPAGWRGRALLADRRIAPLTTVESTECEQSPNAERVQCGICCKVYAGGAVVDSAPRWSQRLGGYELERRVYCDHCHHIQLWREACTASGMPRGEVTDPPSFLRGLAVDQFLHDYPQAVGVVAM